jgi:uracil-DNA glycosylase
MTSTTDTRLIIDHQETLRQCRQCPDMIPPVITCQPVLSKILLVGQAPGDKEGDLGRPFAWTAGKTLFKWFSSIGVEEDQFRKHVYMSAICRCFPGKNPKGGDRVPDKQEILNCSGWLKAEIELLQPELVLLVGSLAIKQFIEAKKLVDVIGQSFEQKIYGAQVDVIPLPHPSGASTWHRMEPGIGLLQQALSLIEKHPAWRDLKKRD